MPPTETTVAEKATEAASFEEVTPPTTAAWSIA